MNNSQYTVMPPSTMLNPTPVVLVSCADPENPENRDMVTLAWAGTINSDPPMVSISVRKERYSHDLIAKSGEFVVNLVDEDMCRAVDFCGVRSGRDLDKAAETGLAYNPVMQKFLQKIGTLLHDPEDDEEEEDEDNEA